MVCRRRNETGRIEVGFEYIDISRLIAISGKSVPSRFQCREQI